MPKIQTYNDGVISIYSVDDIAENGNTPKLSAELKVSLRFEERTVGISRYYTALQANAKVDMLVRTPRNRNVSAQDIAAVNGSEQQYRITLVQYPKDVQPPAMDLSLEAVEANYNLT